MQVYPASISYQGDILNNSSVAVVSVLLFLVILLPKYNQQLVHASAVHSSRYEARGKFGEHERCVRVARGVAESNSSFLSFNPKENFFLEGFVC